MDHSESLWITLNHSGWITLNQSELLWSTQQQYLKHCSATPMHWITLDSSGGTHSVVESRFSSHFCDKLSLVAPEKTGQHYLARKLPSFRSSRPSLCDLHSSRQIKPKLWSRTEIIWQWTQSKTHFKNLVGGIWQMSWCLKNVRSESIEHSGIL